MSDLSVTQREALLLLTEDDDLSCFTQDSAFAYGVALGIALVGVPHPDLIEGDYQTALRPTIDDLGLEVFDILRERSERRG